MRLGSPAPVITPNVVGLLRLRPGLPKFTRLTTLKKSNDNANFTPSVIFVVLPREKSRFQNGRPRNTPRPWRPSPARLIRRKLLNTSSGLANRFKPEPGTGFLGSPAAPTPPEPTTPS